MKITDVFTTTAPTAFGYISVAIIRGHYDRNGNREWFIKYADYTALAPASPKRKPNQYGFLKLDGVENAHEAVSGIRSGSITA